MARTNPVYLRNLRPNAVKFYYESIPYLLERRGHRNDTTTVPEEALEQPTINRLIRQGRLERITKEDFLSLGDRLTDDPQRPLARRASDTALPMNNARDDQPYVIPAELLDSSDFKAEHMSPQLEFADPPKDTASELKSVEE